MKNIYTCGCLANDFHNKTVDELLQIFERPTDYSSFIRINLDDDFYIFCQQITEFCYKAHRYYFFDKTCSYLSGMNSPFYHISCFLLLKYGFKTICQACIIPLQKKLFPFLIKIK